MCLSIFYLETNEDKKFTDKYSTYVVVDDTGIYHWSVNEGTFNHMNLEGGDERVVLSGGDYYNKSSQHIYFIKSGENYDVFVLDLEKETEERLSSFLSEVFDESCEVFSRGTLVESLSKSGKVDCLIPMRATRNSGIESIGVDSIVTK